MPQTTPAECSKTLLGWPILWQTVTAAPQINVSRRAKGHSQFTVGLGRRDIEVSTLNRLKPEGEEERAWKPKPKAIMGIPRRLTAVRNGNHIRMVAKASEVGGQLGTITSLRSAGTDSGGSFA